MATWAEQAGDDFFVATMDEFELHDIIVGLDHLPLTYDPPVSSDYDEQPFVRKIVLEPKGSADPLCPKVTPEEYKALVDKFNHVLELIAELDHDVHELFEYAC